MPLIHFQKRFAEAVRNGEKKQTIRIKRKHPIKPGDKLILGSWTGKPYRSTVERLGEATCVSVRQITIGSGIYRDEVDDDWKRYGFLERELLAQADGFRNYEEMLDWFRQTPHGLPFRGVLIKW